MTDIQKALDLIRAVTAMYQARTEYMRNLGYIKDSAPEHIFLDCKNSKEDVDAMHDLAVEFAREHNFKMVEVK